MNHSQNETERCKSFITTLSLPHTQLFKNKEIKCLRDDNMVQYYIGWFERWGWARVMKLNLM